jgi:hypothetical protein
MSLLNRPAIVFHSAWLALLVALLAGCGKSKSKESAVDLEPFKKAIGEYLERNNMAMAVKEVKEGPVIEETQANLKASLTHATMGGPAVTWEFTLEKDPKGAWKVVSHKP